MIQKSEVSCPQQEQVLAILEGLQRQIAEIRKQEPPPAK